MTIKLSDFSNEIAGSNAKPGTQKPRFSILRQCCNLKRQSMGNKTESSKTVTNKGSCEIDWVSSAGKFISQKGDISFNRLKEYVINGDSQLLRVSFISKEAARDMKDE